MHDCVLEMCVHALPLPCDTARRASLAARARRRDGGRSRSERPQIGAPPRVPTESVSGSGVDARADLEGSRSVLGSSKVGRRRARHADPISGMSCGARELVPYGPGSAHTVAQADCRKQHRRPARRVDS